jgi:hypothetical protein
MPTFQTIARLLHLWLSEVCGDVMQVWQKERYDFVQSTDCNIHSEEDLPHCPSVLELAVLILITHHR